jgi:hypothetical protein
VWVGFPHKATYEKLPPDEADAMADALCAHARYAREQGAPSLGVSPLQAPESEVCGRVLDTLQFDGDQRPICMRPENHLGVCRPHRGVWVGFSGLYKPHEALTAEEAVAMADSPYEHAAYAREQETS